MVMEDNMVSLEHGLAMLAFKVGDKENRESSVDKEQSLVSIPKALSMAYLRKTKSGKYTK